jgi:hypothetical protein
MTVHPEVFDMDDTPSEPAEVTQPPRTDQGLGIDFEALYAAGQRLGPAKSTLRPPRTTFEELQRRAEAFDDANRRRDRHYKIAVLFLTACVIVLSVLLVLRSLPSRPE